MAVREKQSLQIALVQFEAVLCDIKGNTARACEHIAEAAHKGADLVVLPELFSTGYFLDVVGPRLPELMERLDGPTVTALRESAKQHKTYVVASIALEKEDLPGVAWNTAVFIDRSGEIIGSFDKVHLWALERFYFRSGTDFPVFDTEFGKIGLLICYDLGFPEAARMLALKGAELIVCPSAWCEEDHDIWVRNTQCRALENTVFLAAVNRYGQEESLYMGGHTLLCDPRGAVIAELKEEKEDILYAEIDFTAIKRHRVSSPYLRDRRPELYKDVLID